MMRCNNNNWLDQLIDDIILCVLVVLQVLRARVLCNSIVVIRVRLDNNFFSYVSDAENDRNNNIHKYLRHRRN